MDRAATDFRSWANIAREYEQSVDRVDRYRLPGRFGGLIRRPARALARLKPERCGKLARFGETSDDRAQMYFPQSIDYKGPRILLSNPDLSGGGAPKLIVEIAQILRELGYDPLIVTETDGPVRLQCERNFIPLIIHPAKTAPGHSAMLHHSELADLIIANTVLAWPVVDSFSGQKPTIWYSHEISILDEVRQSCPAIDRVFSKATRMWAGSALAAAALRPFRDDIEIVPYGLDPLVHDHAGAGSGDPLRLSLLASIEYRKGQDLAIEAVSLLSPAEQAMFALHIRGRVLHGDFNARLEDLAQATSGVVVGGEMPENEYRFMLTQSDAILLTSRDDTLPLVSLDALSAGRVLMCTPTVGTAAYIEDGVDGFVSASTDPPAIAAMLSRALARRDDWPQIGEAARVLFSTQFSRAKFTQKLRSTIEELLPAHARRPS